MAKVKFNIIPHLSLEIHSKRDWGYSEDYVEVMWKILQQQGPDDFVISSGVTHTVKSFVNKVAREFRYNLLWKGKGQ